MLLLLPLLLLFPPVLLRAVPMPPKLLAAVVVAVLLHGDRLSRTCGVVLPPMHQPGPPQMSGRALLLVSTPLR